MQVCSPNFLKSEMGATVFFQNTQYAGMARRKRGDRTKTCCGDYPYRGWFVGSEDECCEFQRGNKNEQNLWNDFSMRIGKYFDPDSQICCDNGVKGIFELC